MLKSGQQGGRPRKRRRHYEFAKKLTMQAVLNEIEETREQAMRIYDDIMKKIYSQKGQTAGKSLAITIFSEFLVFVWSINARLLCGSHKTTRSLAL